MSRGKKGYLEAIRVIAVILVIFNHTDGFIYYTQTKNGLTWIYSMVLAVVCRAAVPLFFMVSGAVLLGKTEKEEPLKALFQKRIARILTVLAAVSLGYYLFDMGRGRITEAGAGDFLYKLFTNGIRDSFWFLYTYLFVLLTLPFFRKLAPLLYGRLIIYLIALKALSGLLVPFLSLGFGLSVTYDAGFVGGYIYYMLLGYYMSHEGEKDIQKIKTGSLWLCFGGLVILSVAAMVLLRRLTGEYQAAGLDLFVFLTAPVMWLLIKRYTERLPADSRLGRFLVFTGGCVFGVYLLDNFVRFQFLPFYLFLSEKTVGVFANSVYVLLVFSAGVLYTWVLKKIPVIKRYL